MGDCHQFFKFTFAGTVLRVWRRARVEFEKLYLCPQKMGIS